MEIFSDEAIILQVSTVNERDLLVDLLCAEHGRLRGVAKYGATSKKKPIYQPLNHIFFHAKSRLYEQIPIIESELLTPFFSLTMNDATLMLLMQTAGELCRIFLPEKEQNTNIYNELHDFYLAGAPLIQYAIFELNLLQNCGYGLQLKHCVATGVLENLHYISPKSGAAVCASAGAPYHDKLFILPRFYLPSFHLYEQPATTDELRNALQITGYFMNRYLAQGQDKKMPAIRARLIEKINLML